MENNIRTEKRPDNGIQSGIFVLKNVRKYYIRVARTERRRERRIRKTNLFVKCVNVYCRLTFF